MQLPEEFVVRREIHAIQHFGQSLLEPIPPGEVIFAERPSPYAHMIEAVWQQRRYLVFERDLKERTEPVRKPTEEDPPERIWGHSRGISPNTHQRFATERPTFTLAPVLLKICTGTQSRCRTVEYVPLPATRFGCHERTDWFPEGIHHSTSKFV
jgi:hypothetical protein